MSETLQEKLWRETKLPKDLAERCQISFSLVKQLQLVQSYLIKLYGESAVWKDNLLRYFESDEFKSKCRIINTIEDPIEITFDDIKSWLDEEQAYSDKIQQLHRLVTHMNDSGTDDEVETVIEALELLGLRNNKTGGLFSLLINWDKVPKQNEMEFKKSVRDKLFFYKMVIRNLSVLFKNGLEVTYPQLKTVMTQQKHKCYYRGENNYFGSSRPSGFRCVDGQSERLTALLNDLRREEGCVFLDNFDVIGAWSHSSINHIALAQHYGLKTQMIDITSDLMTALFFATCVCNADGTWRPLSSDEIEKDSPRYAILYRTPSEITDIIWALMQDNGSDDISGVIFPVGYQPFRRCSCQHAYGIITRDNNYDLYKATQFEKYKIRLTTDFCNWVFKETDGGRKVFPNEDVPDLSKYFKAINETRKFSRESFDAVLTQLTEVDKRRIRRELENSECEISDDVIEYITEDERKRVNDEYTIDRAKELMGAFPCVFPLITI